jgi:serine/threonine protein kinase
VKPANVLITHPDRFKLADFGVARYDLDGVDRLTRTGDYLGTLGYMAPEQRSDPRAVVPQSDLYAVGATLYNLLSGTARPPPDLYALGVDDLALPSVPPALLPVVVRATRVRPEQRYPDAQTMRNDLADAIEVTWDGPPTG